jgi:hypothetical protein
MAVYTQLGGLEYIEEIGGGDPTRHRRPHHDWWRAPERRSRPVAPTPQTRSAIVMLPAVDPAGAVHHLAAGGIVADTRPGHVRLSPFFYNVQDDHVAALERLASHRGH